MFGKFWNVRIWYATVRLDFETLNVNSELIKNSVDSQDFEGWTGRGKLSRFEFRDFNSVVSQPEDELRKSVCAAVHKRYLSKTKEFSDYRWWCTVESWRGVELIMTESQ